MGGATWPMRSGRSIGAKAGRSASKTSPLASRWAAGQAGPTDDQCCRISAYDGRAVHRVVDPVALQSALSRWFAARGRRLAFRHSREPWGVLVSEVMLQQTQVARVEPAWTAFMARFPSPSALAAASLADVLRAWGGLGYNRRALNLWRAAALVVEHHDGRVPGSLEELRALPGVGGYTARAVAAIAFGMPVAAVDTNVRRVVVRLACGVTAEMSPDEIQSAADALVDKARPDAWTHAVMDLGATVCRLRSPECVLCPLTDMCAYAAADGAEEPAAVRPAAARRGAPAARPFAYTTRWLRGRIVGRLREAEPGDWIAFDAPLGEHSLESVRAAVAALAAEGLLEVAEHGGARLPERAGTAL